MLIWNCYQIIREIRLVLFPTVILTTAMSAVLIGTMTAKWPPGIVPPTQNYTKPHLVNKSLSLLLNFTSVTKHQQDHTTMTQVHVWWHLFTKKYSPQNRFSSKRLVLLLYIDNLTFFGAFLTSWGKLGTSAFKQDTYTNEHSLPGSLSEKWQKKKKKQCNTFHWASTTLGAQGIRKNGEGYQIRK